MTTCRPQRLLLACVIAMLAPAAWVQAAPPLAPATTDKPVWQTLMLGQGQDRYPFPVYANRALDKGALHDIRRVVIVVHGIQRDAGLAYEAAAAVLAANPARQQDTLIVAPKFPSAVDIGFEKMPAWRRNSWEDGELSIAARTRPAPLSSMQVLDDLLQELGGTQRLPVLQTLVLAGHSAGGQLVQRYAVLNDIEPALRRNGLDVQYVVANPSSYLYLTPDRPRANGQGFAPYERGICPSYNQYKYGLNGLPPYLTPGSQVPLMPRYLAREVTYLLGGADNNPEHRFLDKSCGAEAQGATRWARGLGYWRYEQYTAQRHPELASTAHQAQEVVGVAHNAPQMFSSTCGARALLGERSMPLPQAAACRPLPR